jgi:catechol 2,3-dioxygenase-like lactoylglutathione lyase family enzyme
MLRTRSVAIFVLSSTSAFAQTVADAHFHHLHLNATDPKADIEFYTTKFDAEKGSFKGLMDAIWAQKSWILAQKVSTPPPSEAVSTIWHFGWGAEDMKAAYQKQLDSGTRFATPITDISDITGGPPNTGRFFYAYVLGPDGALIELNTANHHNFGHIHLLSADPVAAGEWYAKHFGVKTRSSPQVHMYRGVQIGPSASFNMDNVNVIIYPMEYAISSHMPGWENRKTLEPTKGRVVDHIGVSVPNLDDAIARLRKEGVTITDEPKSIAEGKVKFAFIEGPDKMRIEIIEGQASKDDIGR